VSEVLDVGDEGPDRELGVGGAAGDADGPKSICHEHRDAAARDRPRRLRRHRRLQGGRGVPAAGRRRRPRDAGPHRRGNPVRRCPDVLGAWPPSRCRRRCGTRNRPSPHPSRAERRPHRGGAGDSPLHGPLRRRALRRPLDGHAAGHPGPGVALPGHAHRNVGAPVGAGEPGHPGAAGRRGSCRPPRGRLAGGDSGEGRLADPASSPRGSGRWGIGHRDHRDLSGSPCGGERRRHPRGARSRALPDQPVLGQAGTCDRRSGGAPRGARDAGHVVGIGAVRPMSERR
jgi:hypothetical protein